MEPLLYEREYVDYLQKQIRTMAEMIDAQNILIKNLVSREYKDSELSTKHVRQTVHKER
jgi:hypothetical protein